MAYNQKIEQHEFNQFLTVSDWEDDCTSCASEPHETNAITHECFVCSEFSPHITTYNYFNLIVYLLLPVITFVLIGFLRRKR